MNHQRRSIFFTALFFFIMQPTWANNTVDQSNYWQCSAYDNKKTHWEAKGSYKRLATSKALEACKKESQEPASCNAGPTYCNYFSQGMLVGPQMVRNNLPNRHDNGLWQCTALDRNATPWLSNAFRSQEAAALGAKATCKAHSPIPDSCYINLVTCKNINNR